MTPIKDLPINGEILYCNLYLEKTVKKTVNIIKVEGAVYTHKDGIYKPIFGKSEPMKVVGIDIIKSLGFKNK
jgi:hypothetical protein